MNCPRCKATLTKEEVDNIQIDVCKKCNGMWVHKHQLNELLKESGGDVEEASIDHNPDLGEKYKQAIVCRECTDTNMTKINFLEFSDIILDYCPSCGAFWLDKDELDNMHNYIKKVEEGSHEVKDHSAYNILVRLSEIVLRIYH